MLCETVRLRTHLYYRIAEDDPPNQFARPPCTLKTWWSLAPPNKHRPADAGDARNRSGTSSARTAERG